MVLLFGLPGSGKSSQSALLASVYNGRVVSTGQLFRESNDPKVAKILASGELIDDTLTNQVLGDALTNIPTSTKVILDGYPRDINQAKWLLKHARGFGREVRCAVLLNVPAGELLRRLGQRNRVEDTETVIKHRLDIYHKATQPVLNFLSEQGVPVFTVNGDGEVDEVHTRISKVVDPCLQK